MLKLRETESRNKKSEQTESKRQNEEREESRCPHILIGPTASRVDVEGSEPV